MRIEGRQIVFRSVCVDDAEYILKLRLDKDLSKYLSKVDDDVDSQKKWIQNYKDRESSGLEYYFIIENKNGDRFGCLRIYDFRGDSFCWGSWILDTGSPSYMSIESVVMVYEFAFNVLNFSKCHFDVIKDNQKVIAFHKRFGAEIVDEDSMKYYFNLEKATYETVKHKYSKYLPGANFYESVQMPDNRLA